MISRFVNATLSNNGELVNKVITALSGSKSEKTSLATAIQIIKVIRIRFKLNLVIRLRSAQDRLRYLLFI